MFFIPPVCQRPILRLSFSQASHDDRFENLKAKDKIFDDHNTQVALEQIPFESLLTFYDQPQNKSNSMSWSSSNLVNEPSHLLKGSFLRQKWTSKFLNTGIFHLLNSYKQAPDKINP